MKNPEKILLLTSEFPPQPGGIGQQASSLAGWLHRAGRDIRVVTNSRGEAHRREEKDYDEALPFPVLRARRFRIAGFTYLHRFWLALRQADSPRPVTVLASGKFSLWLAGFFSFFYTRHTYIAILHGSELGLRGPARLLTKWCLRGFDRGVAVSHFTKKLAKALAPRLRVQVIPNGFEAERLDRFPGKAALAGHPALATVGNVTKRKGQQNAIRALPAVLERFPEAHYHIVGLPTEQPAFEALAAELGVRAHITFHGPLPDAELAPSLRGAHLFLMLSERRPDGDVEGFGIAILEANHLGLPAIGANDSGITDAIRDGYSGRLVNPHDPAAVATAVEEIMKDYPAYAARAKTWAGGFTWEKVIEGYLEVL